MEGQSQAERIQRIADIKDKVGFIRGGMPELLIGKVIFAVLIMKLELGGFCFTQGFLERIKPAEIVDKSRALIIVAFINGAVFAMFPKEQGVVAMRTPEFSFVSKAAMEVK